MHIFMHSKIQNIQKKSKYLKKIKNKLGMLIKNTIDIFSILLLTNVYVQTTLAPP